MVETLIVEDNFADIVLTREILSESEKYFYEISTVKDAFEALESLHEINGYGQETWPHLIILDLNLPKMNGFEFLEKIRREPSLKKISVCILTTSSAVEDIEKARELNVVGYLTKPLDLEKFEAICFGSLPDVHIF